MTSTSCALPSKAMLCWRCHCHPDQPQSHPCVAITRTPGCPFQDTVLVNPRGPFATPPRRARISVLSLSAPHTLLLVQTSHHLIQLGAFGASSTLAALGSEHLDKRALVAGPDWMKAVSWTLAFPGVLILQAFIPQLRISDAQRCFRISATPRGLLWLATLLLYDTPPQTWFCIYQ